MFDRIKRVLVKSFIGAIALGYLLAEIARYFVNIFTAPLLAWTTRRYFRGVIPSTVTSPHPTLEALIAPAVAFVLLLSLWYILLRWLYFTPVVEESTTANPETTS